MDKIHRGYDLKHKEYLNMAEKFHNDLSSKEQEFKLAQKGWECHTQNLNGEILNLKTKIAEMKSLRRAQKRSFDIKSDDLYRIRMEALNSKPEMVTRNDFKIKAEEIIGLKKLKTFSSIITSKNSALAEIEEGEESFKRVKSTENNDDNTS